MREQLRIVEASVTVSGRISTFLSHYEIGAAEDALRSEEGRRLPQET